MTMRVLITGASSGIGERLALDYLAQGCEVYACGRDFSQSSLLEYADKNLSLLRFDVTVLAEVTAALKEVNTLDLLILNAGSCEYVDDVLALDTAMFQRVFAPNVFGVINCLSVLMPKLHGGRLGVVSSSVSYLPLPRAEAYGASKAAVDYLTRCLAVDLKAHKIAVSLIQPGFVDTPLTQKNDFPMPCLLTQQQASSAIRKGLAQGKARICPPRRFVWGLRILSILPDKLWVLLAQRIIKDPTDT